MEAGTPAENAAAAPPPAPANVASPKKAASPKTVPSPKKTVQGGDKTDTESAPSTPNTGANDKEKKPRNKNNNKKQPKKEDGGAAAEEGKAEKPADAAGAEKSDKKPKNKNNKKQPKKEDGGAEAVADESKNRKPAQNKNQQNKNKPAAGGEHKVRTVKGKNTEVFVPTTRPVDLRITYDLGGADARFSTSLTSRDVLLAPNVFSDFKPGELYAKLLGELTACGIPQERLLKMWHGNEKIDGTHLIADDKTRWKQSCPTFQLVIDRLAQFFTLNVQATRFNWYKDTSQWKPFHFDAAAVKPEIAAKQNFTVGVSFGATRDAAFEHASTRTVVSVPQPDGCVYAFARDTNVIWRHGILQDAPVRQEGRISVIAWGWIDGMVDAPESVPVAPVTEQKKIKRQNNDSQQPKKDQQQQKKEQQPKKDQHPKKEQQPKNEQQPKQERQPKKEQEKKEEQKKVEAQKEEPKEQKQEQ